MPQLVLDARQIGHPLIGDGVRIRNDYRLPAPGTLDILTGSNMSGKSSFLRTLGVNVVLAYAGAPVCAERLELGLLRLFSSIRVSDSLSDGISYFYAEVRRLRALLAALRADDPAPPCFISLMKSSGAPTIGNACWVAAPICGHWLAGRGPGWWPPRPGTG
ncbi:MAG: hypothetical protein HC915_17635 [Anaerolineae bacterium]|nr:hypothetical protein [Anaerolineae bacterium]